MTISLGTHYLQQYPYAPITYNNILRHPLLILCFLTIFHMKWSVSILHTTTSIDPHPKILLPMMHEFCFWSCGWWQIILPLMYQKWFATKLYSMKVASVFWGHFISMTICEEKGYKMASQYKIPLLFFYILCILHERERDLYTYKTSWEQEGSCNYT